MANPLYSRLDTSRREVRLLVLEPGASEGNVKCKLITRSLDDNPTYEALSYTWGETQFNQSILLNGHPTTISGNLESFLWTISHEREEKVIWVDQICINQSDIVERGQQVQLMRDIYEKAEGLLIWLGLPDDDSDMALELIIALSKLEQNLLEVPTILAVAQTPEMLPYYQALQKFLGRSWFKRTWIVQELALSQHEIMVICGERWLPWFTIARAAENLEHHRLMWFSGNTLFYTINIASVTSLQMLHRHPENNRLHQPRPTLFDLCWMLRAFQATDPRDKIFGFMGLATDLKRSSSFFPDYTKAVVQTYLEFVRFLITENKSLEFLRVASRATDSDFPSWAPDWRDSLSRSVTRPGYDSRVPKFSATGVSIPDARLSDDLKTLIVHGYAVQSIELLGDVLHHARSAPTLEKDTIVAVLRSWEDLATEVILDPYPNGQSRLEAFWRTLLGNSDVDAQDIPTSNPSLDYALMLERYIDKAGDFVDMPNRDDLIGKYARPFTVPMIRATYEQRYFVTNRGYMGFCPIYSRVGDLICLLPGTSVPIILRKIQDHYVLVGECYCHGMMKGEIFNTLGEDNVEEQVFNVI
ncbi:hypothetical protein GLAREA_09505 [Glarea lozoyensis ATCC 20868]|uniref:Heterokaryon incompatibility domain-containing protein n=1 Tax=Glarea lozoyensis (strain ATCC 20868 / MF5171) TaxID=1116229 RepID=S3CRT9_GLAL2|nr:uncharacterized protein GLAREA_09505 [Glarea lozoyensis ATCC 20868]EPE28385.1 hypothetical protein GLAREA_09505 [Glarea lozoyensis ATCC 20868]